MADIEAGGAGAAVINTWERRQCCPDVRWCDGVLQQLWNVCEMQGHRVIGARSEWCPVPVVSDAVSLSPDPPGP